MEQAKDDWRNMLQQIDFDWTRRVDSVWDNTRYHVKALHSDIRDDISQNMVRLAAATHGASPPGEIILGQSGVGKTHFLGTLRETVSQDAFFVLVDMTDVNDFWNTVRLGYLDSLYHKRALGESQSQEILLNLLSSVGVTKDPKAELADLADSSSERLIARYVDRKLLGALNKRYPKEIPKYKDVVRALFLLNADDYLINAVGYSWLQGIGIEDEDKRKFGFRWKQPEAKLVVEALSWCMSLVAPTLLAFDQLDAIVAQHHIASAGINEEKASEEERASAAIIQNVAGGLMAAMNTTVRTMSVVSCLVKTWNILEQRAVSAFSNRFRQPGRLLRPVDRSEVAREIAIGRVQPVLKKLGISDQHAEWPFKANSFNNIDLLIPREILKACDGARRRILAEDQFSELDPFNSTGSLPLDEIKDKHEVLKRLDQQYQQLKARANLAELINPNNEDGLVDDILEAACRCLKLENPTEMDLDLLVDEDFTNAKKMPPLHVRLRFVFHNEGDREEHISFRVIHKTNAISFQSRLKAAITAAGIDHRLSFRKLIIIRSNSLPGGKVTEQLWSEFLERGGIHVNLNDDSWRSLKAISEMERENDTAFANWLQIRKPVCKISLFEQSGACCYFKGIDGSSKPEEKIKQSPPPQPPQPPETINSANQLAVGRRLIGNTLGEMMAIEQENLIRHSVILAGSGSGKTVLVRRMVEEAALMGIPSIVIDPANDLARLGDAWPEEPAAWFEGDKAKAECYLQNVDVKVWTPGREKGRPMQLSPLPDFAAVVGDADELETAIMMAQESLRDIVAKGTSNTAETKVGVLTFALRYMIEQGGSTLQNLVDLLTELPVEASGGISTASKKAAEMADAIRAKMATDILLRSQGEILDPGQLLQGSDGKTAISVINLHGLPSQQMQQRFIGQLAVSLFSWIKKHPASTEKPVSGLLVIDEAKDFVPSQGGASSKAPLIRLAAQARKYGLGLIFATQAPNSIHHEVTANCTNHFYGKASSPRATEVIRELLKQRGADGGDIPRMEKGTFYAYSEGYAAALKIRTPLCLSHHANTPLTEDEVVKRAKK